MKNMNCTTIMEYKVMSKDTLLLQRLLQEA